MKYEGTSSFLSTPFSTSRFRAALNMRIVLLKRMLVAFSFFRPREWCCCGKLTAQRLSSGR